MSPVQLSLEKWDHFLGIKSQRNLVFDQSHEHHLKESIALRRIRTNEILDRKQ